MHSAAPDPEQRREALEDVGGEFDPPRHGGRRLEAVQAVGCLAPVDGRLLQARLEIGLQAGGQLGERYQVKVRLRLLLGTGQLTFLRLGVLLVKPLPQLFDHAEKMRVMMRMKWLLPTTLVAPAQPVFRVEIVNVHKGQLILLFVYYLILLVLDTGNGEALFPFSIQRVLAGQRVLQSVEGLLGEGVPVEDDRAVSARLPDANVRRQQRQLGQPGQRGPGQAEAGVHQTAVGGLHLGGLLRQLLGHLVGAVEAAGASGNKAHHLQVGKKQLQALVFKDPASRSCPKWSYCSAFKLGITGGWRHWFSGAGGGGGPSFHSTFISSSSSSLLLLLLLLLLILIFILLLLQVPDEQTDQCLAGGRQRLGQLPNGQPIEVDGELLEVGVAQAEAAQVGKVLLVGEAILDVGLAHGGDDARPEGEERLQVEAVDAEQLLQTRAPLGELLQQTGHVHQRAGVEVEGGEAGAEVAQVDETQRPGEGEWSLEKQLQTAQRRQAVQRPEEKGELAQEAVVLVALHHDLLGGGRLRAARVADNAKCGQVGKVADEAVHPGGRKVGGEERVPIEPHQEPEVVRPSSSVVILFVFLLLVPFKLPHMMQHLRGEAVDAVVGPFEDQHVSFVFDDDEVLSSETSSMCSSSDRVSLSKRVSSVSSGRSWIVVVVVVVVVVIVVVVVVVVVSVIVSDVIISLFFSRRRGQT
ncbi:hypothetical protein TYRP_011277 [Tyrophagus putrescentiae]|nr:hypothetical protein TYRP_011277 [Tyrophagus putrescentiae]